MADKYRVEVWASPDAPDPAALRKTLASEGYAVFEWCDKPGTEYGSHKHAEAQSHWILSGSLELTIMNGGTHVLNPGDRDFMSAGTYHSARVTADEAAVYLVGAKTI